MNIESSTNLSNDNPQRKIIYVGGDDEDYLGTNINGRDNESFNNEQNYDENTNSNRDLNHNSIEKTSEPIHERHLNHNNNKYDSTHQEQYGGNKMNSTPVIHHQEDEFMYGGGGKSKTKSRNGSRSGDDIESSDDETDTSSISTAQLLNVDPVYFRLTKFLTCTDSCGENKNVTHVLNDILTEFKKMNIFLETLTRK
jgi:hypothetical protein